MLILGIIFGSIGSWWWLVDCCWWWRVVGGGGRLCLCMVVGLLQFCTCVCV